VQLQNSFSVPVAVDEAWRVMLDVERIAPCLPGAKIDSIEGDQFNGHVKVKLGPIALTYVGSARFVEQDAAAKRVVLEGRGRDQRGNGTAAAMITAQLHDQGQTTRVDVSTDLDVTGKPAQFGRGVMGDVSAKLIAQFADRLAAQLESGDAPAVTQSRLDLDQPIAATGSQPQASSVTSKSPSPPQAIPTDDPEDSLDVLGIIRGMVASSPVAKVVLALLAVGVLLPFIAKRRRSPAASAGVPAGGCLGGQPVSNIFILDPRRLAAEEHAIANTIANRL
jgi:carbon monoxide dehydrogenase subunit G